MKTNSPLFLGLDVGTQSVRAALFDAAGACRGFGVAPLDTFHPQPAWAEQDAHQWWAAARAAVPEALGRAGARPDDVAGDRPRLHRLHRDRLRPRRHAAAPAAAVDGPALLPRGRRHQRHKRPDLALGLRRRVAGMDAAQGAVAEAARAGGLRPRRPRGRMHRLVHAPADRRMDAVAQ